MRRLFKKKVRFLGKEISVFMLVIVGFAALGSAALIPYFGQIFGIVDVSQGLVLDGGQWDIPIEVNFDPFTSLEEATRTSSHQLENNAEVIALFGLVSECSTGDSGNDCEGVETHVEYPLSANGVPVGNEDRVVISAEEAGVSTLNDLDSMSWDALVNEGYLPHVDVFLDIDGDGGADDLLVFEYAKVDPNNCDNAPYPIGELNTFADKGILEDGAWAWLGSGPPGPCGDPNFLHHSLADWRAGLGPGGITGDTAIVRLELEVDNWILDSNSDVSGIEVNEVSVDGSYLGPGETLDFNLVHEFARLLVPDTYTIETRVESGFP